MEIVTIKIGEIKPYAGNAKTHPQSQIDQIKESIRRFGMDDPIGVWGDRNIIVEGHGRFIACKELGFDEVPCIRLDHLTDAERREYTLIHNKTTMNSDFDDSILGEELEWIKENDSSIDMSDFDFGSIEDEKEAVEDDYDPIPPTDPKTKRGDVWILGDHTLMCGDSTSEEDVATLMGGRIADMVLTDPPYNVAVKNAKGMTIENDDMGSEAFREFIGSAMGNASRFLKEGGSFYIWYGDKEDVAFRTACFSNGLTVKQCLIWVKSHFTLGRQDYQWQHEPCLYGWKDGAGHYFVDERNNSTIIDWRKRPEDMTKEELVEFAKSVIESHTSTAIDEKVPTKDDLHPTMKPITLMARQIRNSSKRGDLVLDLFGGSGSTLIACEQIGRKCAMMEYDPKYADVIIDRWEKMTGLKAERKE